MGGLSLRHSRKAKDHGWFHCECVTCGTISMIPNSFALVFKGNSWAESSLMMFSL